MKKIQLNAWQFVCILFLAICWTIQAEPPSGQAIKPQRGEILKVERDQITVMPFTPPKENERDEPVTYILNDKTRIFVSHAMAEKGDTAGNKTRKYDSALGNRDDLKVGLRARVDADNGQAIRVTVFVDELKHE